LQACLNCSTHFKGNFCPHCGQSATVKRITAAVLLEDIMHFFTHLEKGFLHTTWNLLVKPGFVSLNYLAGKRKKYQKPVSYFLIWTGLYILAHNIIINYFQYRLPDEDASLPGLSQQANMMLRTHFTTFIIPLLFISALLLYYIMARPTYYFFEVLAVCLFGAGTYFMMLLLSDIVLGSIFSTNILTVNIFSWQTLLSSLYNFWFTYNFFKRRAIRFFWLRLISVTLLITLIGWVILVYLPVLWIYLTG
jgi:hypothetical protein